MFATIYNKGFHLWNLEKKSKEYFILYNF